jgi:long-chain acyl-CoA synthetase
MYTNLVEMLEQSCKKYWWKKALLAEDRVVRYYKICKETNLLASSLEKVFDIKPQDKIAVLLGNSSVYPIVYFSILKIGAVVVPLNTFLKGEELKYIINNSGAVLLITSKEFLTEINEVRSDLVSLKNIILTDNKNDVKGYVSLQEIMDKGNSDFVPRKISPDSTAVIIYTSGTTGYPKGAMLTHENLVTNVKCCVDVCRVNKKDRLILVLPMFHSFTMTVCMLMPLAAGSGIVIASTLHQFKKVFKSIVVRGVTVLVGIPSIYLLLARASFPWWIRMLLKIRFCISGAAPLPETTLNEFQKKWKIPLVEGYGLSEASPVVSLNPVYGVKKTNSVGLPLPGLEVKIVGPDEGEIPNGQVGEIIIKGKSIMKGYYNNEEATKATLKNGWLFTGDLGFIDNDKYIHIVDRKKDMILVRGLNVYPREVENIIQEYQGVSEVAVIGKPDENKGEVPVAFVVPKNGFTINSSDILKYCRHKLADYKLPRNIYIKEDLPRTPTGKILKRELKTLV